MIDRINDLLDRYVLPLPVRFLTFRFVIVLTYLPFGSTTSDPSDSTSDIVSAVREQLGLRLQSQRGVVDVLKIESVDKVPTEN